MKLNIQLFASSDEAGFDPSAFNTMASEWDSNVNNANTTVDNGLDVMAVFRSVAGSPTISEEFRSVVNSFNEAIDSTSQYFASCNSWANDVNSSSTSLLGTGVQTMNSRFNTNLMDNLTETYSGNMIGMSKYSDATTLMDGMRQFSDSMSTNINGVSDAVAGANNALPSAVLSALSTTVSSNNDDIINAYNKISTAIGEKAEVFAQQLQSAYDSWAAGASGGK